MTRAIVASALGMLLCAAAGRAEAASWSVDPAKSKVGFTGTQSEAPFTGQFKTFSATIDFDPAKPEAAHVVVNIDVSSASTGDAQKDEAMPGADWFAVSQFAKATFESTGFTSKGGDAYETTGKLSLRGVAKDVTLPFTLTLAGDTAHAVGHVKLLRTDFGVGQGSWSTGDMVALDVTVDVDLTATEEVAYPSRFTPRSHAPRRDRAIAFQNKAKRLDM